MDESVGTTLFWGAVIAATLLARVSLESWARLQVFRALLVVLALGEGLLGFVAQVFAARRSLEREGRPYDPAYHGVVQDFGFYNLAFAALFLLAARDPARHAGVVAVALGLYLLHGGTHVLRFLGLYYGGETPIATRPRSRELAQGLTLLASALGVALFRP
jgi:hypothetical protein